MNILELQNVSYIYGLGTPFRMDALKNINIGFEKGKITGVIGHTGSGKSTLVQMLNGLIKPHEGKVMFDGKDIWEHPKKIRNIRFKVGLVMQYPEYQLFDDTVKRDIGFALRNMNLPKEEIDRRVEFAADFVGIDRSYFDKSPFELSGGQKRRAAIAGVVAMDPEVLVLDEPAAGLDPAGREEIIGGLLEYRKKRKSTMIIISHSMEDIAKYSDYIVVLNRGEVYMKGTPEEIFSRAEELFNASLDLPQITKLFIELKKRGIADATDIYTVNYGKKQLEQLLK